MEDQQRVMVAQDCFDLEKDKHLVTIAQPNLGVISTESNISIIKERPKMVLNPDIEARDEMLKQIDLLDGQCPCRIMNFDHDTECPCDEFIYQGECKYGLFIERND